MLLDAGSEGGQLKQQVVSDYINYIDYIDHISDVCIVNEGIGFWMPTRGRLGAKRPPLFKLEPHYIDQNSMYLSSEGTYVCKAFSPRCYVIQKVLNSDSQTNSKSNRAQISSLDLNDVLESRSIRPSVSGRCNRTLQLIDPDVIWLIFALQKF